MIQELFYHYHLSSLTITYSAMKNACAGENQDEPNTTISYKLIFVPAPSVDNTTSNRRKNNYSSTIYLKYTNEKRLQLCKFMKILV